VSYPWLLEAQQQVAEGMANGRLAHACLIAGPRGLGKVEFALQMAADLLCMEPGPAACGTCRSCELLVGGAHPDFTLTTFEINPQTEKMRTVLVVDQIRDLIASLQLTRSLSPRKVAVIHPAEALNESAGNALLKMLEEPPADTYLLLVAHDPSRLPSTIRSRCQAIHVRLPDTQTACDWLTAAPANDAQIVALALEATAGSPLHAQRMLATGQVDQYRTFASCLARLEARESTAGEAAAALADLDPDDMWKWLSLAAAKKLRACLSSGGPAAPALQQLRSSVPAGATPARIAALQNLADRNRAALSTSLHKDLLLRDWLIQWSRLVNQ
jgi:DNA polymerase-3 subunit delta'